MIYIYIYIYVYVYSIHNIYIYIYICTHIHSIYIESFSRSERVQSMCQRERCTRGRRGVAGAPDAEGYIYIYIYIYYCVMLCYIVPCYMPLYHIILYDICDHKPLTLNTRSIILSTLSAMSNMIVNT